MEPSLNERLCAMTISILVAIFQEDGARKEDAALMVKATFDFMWDQIEEQK